MPEFNAKMAREFVENCDKTNAEIWYAEFKEGLFQTIKSTSLVGNNSVNIASFHWDEEGIKREYLKDKLTSLGYSVKIDSNVMTVSW